MRHKYHNQPTTRNGIRFDSKKEANYYSDLLLRQRGGEVITFLRQVPFYLPGGTVYRCDFLEFHADGTVHFIDVKGVRTRRFDLLKKQVENLYAPIEIEVV